MALDPGVEKKGAGELEMVRLAFPELVRVINSGPEAVPPAWLPNATAEKLASGARPVPDKPADCGLPEAVSVKFKLAEKVDGFTDAVVGAKVIFTTQLELAASVPEVGHVVKLLFIVNWPALDPDAVIAMLEIVTAVVLLLFCTVTQLLDPHAPALLVPTLKLPSTRLLVIVS